MSDRAILREVGRRLRRRRLDKNWSQQTLADRAGVARMTVSLIERGSSGSLLTLIQILRALGELEALQAFLPDPGASPLELARLRGRARQRASRRRSGGEGGDS
jgi:transcriptional regulator with XRE-family HTH domain